MKRCSQFFVILLCFIYSGLVSAEPMALPQTPVLFWGLIFAGISFISGLLFILYRKKNLRVSANITLSTQTPKDPLSVQSNAHNKFLSLVSHELRTPMNGIIGSLHVLDRAGLKEEQAVCIQQVKVSAQEMMYLITELLEYSVMQAEALTVHEIAVNMRDSLLRLFRRVEVKCEHKKIKFNGSIADDVPHYLWLDAKKCMTILEHLLDNAWKYTREGSIDCMVSMNKKNELVIQVSDTGIGIAHQYRTEIFKPFKQVEGYAERSVGGLGLGLSICYAFAKAMQGEVTYLVTPTSGSNFLVTLPVRAMATGDVVQLECSKFTAEIPDEPPAEAAASPAALVLTPQKSHKKREEIKILIVDDNTTNCFVAKGIVKKLGYQSETVLTAESALSLLSEQEFDLVLMDCQMPVMDGFQATTKLRQLNHPNSQIPVIAVTANTLPNDRQMCLDHGMNDYMTKPINMVLLEERISYWLSLSERDVSLKALGGKSEKAEKESKKIISWAKYKK